jgi:hypothetical protein
VCVEADVFPLVAVLPAEGIINLVLVHLFEIFGELEVLQVLILILAYVGRRAGATRVLHLVLFLCRSSLVAVVLLVHSPF